MDTGSQPKALTGCVTAIFFAVALFSGVFASNAKEAQLTPVVDDVRFVATPCAGRMVIGNPRSLLRNAVDFDIERFLRTSRFMIDFPPLRSENMVARESERQRPAKSRKVLVETNLVNYGGGMLTS